VADTQGDRKSRIGTVTSDKMEKTITVSVETVKQHPLYKKTVKTSKKYKVHDENNEAKTGDVVKIIETRPLSKDKRWRLVEIVQKAKTLG
jgi:small subunit ribosomal protein S17